MTAQPARDRAHARQRLDDAWRAVGQLPADLRGVQVGFANLSEEPTREERAALAAALNRALDHIAEAGDALLAVRQWVSPSQTGQLRGEE